jgi:NADH:ubiquinone oxidoreductase subunit 5 (subunit L)/multisubunit Na+/H+ antiporter MnhA subunit
MTVTAALWALVLLPPATGGLLLVTGRRGDRLAGPVAVLASAAVLGLAVAVAAGRPRVVAPWLAGLPIGLGVDTLSAALVVTVAAVTLAVLVFATGDIRREDARARFFGLMLIFAGAMLVAVTATSLGPLLVAWEVMGATSYALIGFWWREERRAAAATTAFVTTRTADLGFYLAAAAAYAGAANLNLTELPQLPTPYLHLVTAGLLAAAVGKSGQLPFSFWLSRAMEGPSPVSALLHSATMVAAGAYLLLRLDPLLAASGWGRPATAAIGAATALALGGVAVFQRDLKQLLAASTAAQMGFVLVAAGAGGIAAGAAQLVAHAATKSLLFLAAGAWLTALGTKRIDALRGAGRDWPRVGVPFAVGALSLAGVPPLALWVTKDDVLAAALADNAVLYATAVVAATLSAAYAGVALGTLFAPAPPDAASGYDTEERATRRVRPAATAVLAVLAAAVVVLAVLLLARAGPIRAPEPAVAQMAFSGALAVVVLVAVIRATVTGGLPHAAGGWQGVLARWLDLEALAHRVVVAPALGLARALARFDDRVVDRAVEALARGGLRLAEVTTRRFEEPVLDGAVSAIARAARALGRLARRPQTGLAHQYYAQALVLLAGLLVILLVAR